MKNPSPPDLDRVREVFSLVADLPRDECRLRLDALCAEEPELRAEVERLLQHHDQSSGFLESPAVVATGMAARSGEIETIGAFEPGEVIGGFTIERCIGAGGMGMVYAARQHEPERLVALKVMRPGLASRSALRRFVQEGNVLARLTHPAIARVYASGVDRRASGILVPFLAMELVEGITLDQFIAERDLRVLERIDLFIRIVSAVAHAHQRGVIHRDLKPANILITADGDPRILDFGIAHLLDEPAETTRLTGAGQIAGTLAYMSPEQLDGDPMRIDVRTDVYALGVLLYEALSGALPIDVAGSSLDKAVAAIRTHEPVRLSRRDGGLRGDLDVIVAKALEKDPDQRYLSAAELADDLRRYRRHEPIQARRASAVYRTRKFVRRHSVLVVAAAAVLIVMSVGLMTTLWQAREADAARVRAERRAEVARQTNAFLRDLFLAVDRARLRGEDPTLRDAVADATARLERGPPALPLVEAEIRSTIGRVHSMLGDHEQAVVHHKRATELLDRLLGPSDPEALEAAANLATALAITGQSSAAERLTSERLAMARPDGPSAGARARLLTVFAGVAPDLDQARAAGDEAADLAAAIYGPEHEYTLAALSNLARVFGRAGDWSEAESLARRCVDVRSERLAPGHPDRVRSEEDLAAAVRRQGRVEESAALMEEVVAMGHRVVPVDHPEQVENRLSAANLLFREGHYERSAALVRSALPLAEVDGQPTRNSVRCLGFLCTILTRQQRYDEAETLAAQTVAAAERCFGPWPEGEDPPDGVIQSWTVYFNLYAHWNRADELSRWRDKLASTRTGRAILQMGGHAP